MDGGIEPKLCIWIGLSHYFVESISTAFEAARMRFQPLTFVRFEIDLRAGGLGVGLDLTQQWIERIARAGDAVGTLSDGRLGMLAIGRTVEQMRADLEALWDEAIADTGKAARMPTLSFGVAGVEGMGDTIDGLFDRAEAALRYGRRTGGWKVVSAFRSGAMVVSDFQALMLERAVWRLQDADDSRPFVAQPAPSSPDCALAADWMRRRGAPLP